MKRILVFFLALYLCVGTAWADDDVDWLRTPIGMMFTYGGDDQLLLDWPLTNTLVPTKAERDYLYYTSPTFTRTASPEVVFQDFEGVYTYQENADAAVFKGARYLEQLYPTSGTPANQTVTLNTGVYLLQTASGTITSAAGTATGSGFGAATSGSPNTFTLTAYGTVTLTVASSPSNAGLYNLTGAGDTTTEREFVDSATDYGAGINGLRFFNTDVAGSAIAAATLDGIQLEPASTNKVEVYSRTGADLLGAELMPNQVARDFSGASAWTNVDIDAYDETTDMTITATAGAQYAELAVAEAPTTLGKNYRLTVAVANLVSTWTVKDFTGTQTIGTIDTDASTESFDFIATTTGGLRIVAVDGSSSADLDDFSLKEMGGTKISDGSAVSGLGTGAIAKHDDTFTGTAPDIQNPIPGMTLSGSETEGSELIVNQVARDFSGASAWTNVDINAYDETTDMTITATAGAQYAELAVAEAPTTVGKLYKVEVDVANLVSTWTLKSFDDAQTIGTIDTDASTESFEFVATTTGGFRVVAVDGSSSADLDNFTLLELTYPAELSIVDDSTALAAANLDRIAPSGKSYQVDNSGGSTVANVDLTGALSAADHNISFFLRGTTGASDGVTLRTNTVDGTEQAMTAGWARYNETITAQASDTTRLEVNAGDTVIFLFPTSGVETVPSSMVLTEGASNARTATKGVIPQAGNFSHTNGTIFIDWTPSSASADYADGSYGIVSLEDNDAGSVLYWFKSGGTVELRMTDGTNTASEELTPVAGTTFKLGGRWNTLTGKMQLTVDGTSGSEATYDGAFATNGTDIEIGYGTAGTSTFKNDRIFNIDKGTTYVETQTTP